MRIGTKIAAIAAAGLLLTGCAMNTNPDERGLEYNAGPFQATEFTNCIDPSAKEYKGPNDKQFLYPAGQRTYKFQGDGATVDAPSYDIAVAGSDKLDTNGNPVESSSTIQVGIGGTLTFELSIADCENFRKLHEKIGLKSGATGSGFSEADWSSFLDTYLGGPLERALSRAADNRSWVDLYGDPTALQEYEKAALELLPELVEQQAGGSYFGNFTLQLNRPTLSDDLVNALSQTEEAIQQNRAQQERNVQVGSELEAIRQLVDVLGPEGYNTYQAIKDGKITIMPIPQGSSVVLPAPQTTP